MTTAEERTDQPWDLGGDRGVQEPEEKPRADEVVIRYVAGISAKDDGEPIYSVASLVETRGGDRLASGLCIVDMNREQVEHLHMQLGVVLGLEVN